MDYCHFPRRLPKPALHVDLSSGLREPADFSRVASEFVEDGVTLIAAPRRALCGPGGYRRIVR
jgi:hypothetical protein